MVLRFYPTPLGIAFAIQWIVNFRIVCILFTLHRRSIYKWRIGILQFYSLDSTDSTESTTANIPLMNLFNKPLMSNYYFNCDIFEFMSPPLKCSTNLMFNPFDNRQPRGAGKVLWMCIWFYYFQNLISYHIMELLNSILQIVKLHNNWYRKPFKKPAKSL